MTEESSVGDESRELPPSDAEEWTDEQWIDWLKATDPDSVDPQAIPKMTRIAQTSGGQVLGQAMLGLSRAIYGRQDDEVVIVGQRNSDPEEDKITVHLDLEHPEQSTVVLPPSKKQAD